MYKFLFALSCVAFGVNASADFQPFNHDIFCFSKTDGTLVRISYDKSEYPDFGWQGGIHVEINVGIGQLSAITQSLGIEQPYRRTLRIAGPAGQIGNWIAQDANDNLKAIAKVTFTPWQLLKEDGTVEKEFRSFIATVRLSRVTESGFLDDSSKVSTRDYVLVEVRGGLDGFGTHYARFDAKECN